MGLDMFLKGRRSLWHATAEQQEQLNQMFPEIQGRAAQDLFIEAAYWRKANHIHAWFVRECQAGVDDCGEYPVYRTQLVTLRDLCQQVQRDPGLATTLLPRQQGFFFGDVEYGERYLYSLEDTVAQLDFCLSLPEQAWSFTYSSSW